MILELKDYQLQAAAKVTAASLARTFGLGETTVRDIIKRILHQANQPTYADKDLPTAFKV
jgi:hypothetical protein